MSEVSLQPLVCVHVRLYMIVSYSTILYTTYYHSISKMLKNYIQFSSEEELQIEPNQPRNYHNNYYLLLNLLITMLAYYALAVSYWTAAQALVQERIIELTSVLVWPEARLVLLVSNEIIFCNAINLILIIVYTITIIWCLHHSR